MENHQWIFDNRPAAVKCHPEFKTRKGDAIVHLHMLGGTDNLDQVHSGADSFLRFFIQQ